LVDSIVIVEAGAAVAGGVAAAATVGTAAVDAGDAGGGEIAVLYCD
jgi:hypothetical protein